MHVVGTLKCVTPIISFNHKCSMRSLTHLINEAARVPRDELWSHSEGGLVKKEVQQIC
jgi:hypothetical protein